MKITEESLLFDPRICTYKLPSKERNHIRKLIESKDVDSKIKEILEELMDKDETNHNTLDYESLVKLHKYIQRADEDYIDPFYIFSESCKCIRPKPRENKLLEKRLSKLRLKDSHSMYNNMTASVDRVVEDNLERQADGLNTGNSSKIYSDLDNKSSSSGRNSLSSEFKKLNGSMVAVFNSFLVFICTFIFCYKALEYALPRPNVIAQVSFGLGGSLVVAIAELYFLVRVL